MAPTSRTLLALSLLLSSTAPTLLASADSTVGAVEPSYDTGLTDGLFDYDYSEFDDPLPAPEPADFESLNEDELATVFERSIDGAEAAVASLGWHAHSLAAKNKRALGKAWTGTTTLKNGGATGAENNALQIDGHSAWGTVYTISTQKVRALNMITNSFCAGGGWLSNGTLVSVGGNPVESYENNAAGGEWLFSLAAQDGQRLTAAGPDGLAGIRLFTPCSNDKCDVYENPSRIRLMPSLRRHPNNANSTDNPTFEYYPPKGNGLQIYSSFLHDALNSNLFPVMYTLPNGYVFMAANQMAMLYDTVNNVEHRLKKFPNGVTITYPASAASVLLPMTVANSWTPEIMFCGGTTANLDVDPSQLSATVAASKQCSRMVLNTAGMKAGWKTETMPYARVMADAILTPDMKIFIVNGAQQGIAGYGNVLDEVGSSNSRSPAKQPVLYEPTAASGKRFSIEGLPKASIERLYHSSATLMPDGRIWTAGSNPNDDALLLTLFYFIAPYMTATRPTFTKGFARLLYGKQYSMTVSVPSGTKYSTHGVHMNHRLVELESTWSNKKLTIKGPKNIGIYQPGYAWLYVLADGIPSEGTRIMVGPGTGPPVSESAIKNMLKKTTGA
ncbi:SPOSA6832_00785 [Sporobolomyces salmonicolor]|uniref:SPOSA6832_00785-mRNA-1:cds n=1 Tax=Sporidiobolus salmonicolor TaxID=5005 RepID=A0A0D6EHK4_SPOSA|nr:SPOSA6832_00785 [Sporobolomyces salmonicolor]